MRRVLPVLFAASVLVSAAPGIASAQVMGGQQGGQSQRDRPAQEAPESSRAPRIAPLSQRANAGPCPYVKILYDAARYVELTDNRAAVSNVGYTGEIQGVAAGCSYRELEPITVQVDALFSLGRGPQATSDQRTYRYWIAVTERNNAVLTKEYYDLPVNFEGAQTTSVTEKKTIVIPRAGLDTSGSNFEILIGFEVTPEMAEFNRSGSRFRVNAGRAPAAPAPAQTPAQPPVQ